MVARTTAARPTSADGSRHLALSTEDCPAEITQRLPMPRTVVSNAGLGNPPPHQAIGKHLSHNLRLFPAQADAWATAERGIV